MYGGQIVKDGHEIGFCLCVVYVDDILLLSTTKEAEEHVVATLSSVVPVKTTGEIGEEGGSLTFIGRVIKREREIPLRSRWVLIHIILTLRFWIMVLPVGLRMCLTFRDIWRKHSRIATFRNLCQMKHTHASGRRWENCFGCHRCVMT